MLARARLIDIPPSSRSWIKDSGLEINGMNFFYETGGVAPYWLYYIKKKQAKENLERKEIRAITQGILSILT